MVEQLIADISAQLKEHMEHLMQAVDDVEASIESGDEIHSGTESTVERSAAGVIAAVGALRALMEASEEDPGGKRGYPKGERD